MESLKAAADAASQRHGQKMADPLLYNVPVYAPCVVGRNMDVLNLWQNVLSGKHVQVLQGVDGLGKSTLLSEFCEHAKGARRFTCIQWFNAQHSLKEQIASFVVGMKGRQEQDVLLILDDVDDVEEALRLAPTHENVYLLLSTSRPHQGAIVVPPLDRENVVAMLLGVAEVPASVATDIAECVQDVPLLVILCGKIVAKSPSCKKELLTAIERAKVAAAGALSISACLDILVAVAVREISTRHPDGAAFLGGAACCHAGDLSPQMLSTLSPHATSLAKEAWEYGLFTHKWETESYAMHDAVSRALRKRFGNHEAAAVGLLSLWPRRWRAMDSGGISKLVWHTLALAAVYQDDGVNFPVALVACIDRAATYLSHLEGKEHLTAITLWRALCGHYQKQEVSSAAVHANKELGRLLYYVREFTEAKVVLQNALHLSRSVYGMESVETSMIMALFAPFCEELDAEVGLSRAAATLAARSAGSDDGDEALGKEERQELQESLLTLLLVKAQLYVEHERVVPQGLREEIICVRASLEPPKPMERSQQKV